MAAYRESARGLDVAAKEWHAAIPGYNQAVKEICDYRQGFVERCFKVCTPVLFAGFCVFCVLLVLHVLRH